MNAVSSFVILLQNFDGTVTPMQVFQQNNYTQDLKEAFELSFHGRNKKKLIEPNSNFSTFILNQVRQVDVQLFKLLYISFHGD